MPRLTIAIAAALCALLVPASAAPAAVTIGESFVPDDSFTCSGNATFTQTQLAGEGPSYEAPTSGVITSWSHRTGSVPDEAKLKVLRGGENPFEFVGESAIGLTPSGTEGTYGTRIPVQAGDRLGLFMKSSAPCASPSTSDYTLYVLLLDHTEGSIAYVPLFQRRLDVSAVLEADGDGDGFGDESQDRCPGKPGGQDGCPPSSGPVLLPVADLDKPETVLRKRPANRTHKRRVTYRFAADEQGASFQCKADRKPWKPCVSPLKLKRLTIGKHAFKVRAIDDAGNVDPTAAKDRFRVLG